MLLVDIGINICFLQRRKYFLTLHKTLNSFYYITLLMNVLMGPDIFTSYHILFGLSFSLLTNCNVDKFTLPNWYICTLYHMWSNSHKRFSCISILRENNIVNITNCWQAITCYFSNTCCKNWQTKRTRRLQCWLIDGTVCFATAREIKVQQDNNVHWHQFMHSVGDGHDSCFSTVGNYN